MAGAVRLVPSFVLLRFVSSWGPPSGTSLTLQSHYLHSCLGRWVLASSRRDGRRTKSIACWHL